MTSAKLSVRLCLLAAAAVACLEAVVPLSIVNATIRQMEDGASLPPGFTHVPGELLFFSFLVEGYSASSEQKVHLSYSVEVLDPKGVRVIEPIKGVIDETLAYEDKNWKPKVHPQIQIPPLARSGVYRIAVAVSDDLAKAKATKEITFDVRGHDVEPGDSLVIRNFHFFRGQQDTEPMEDAVYRPGETLWARFDITGYKYGTGNRIDVTYGVTVLGPGGKVLYSQPEAAAEKSSAYYPQPYIPSGMNLSLQRDIRPGEYSIVIAARDLVGNQTFESRQSFGIQ